MQDRGRWSVAALFALASAFGPAACVPAGYDTLGDPRPVGHPRRAEHAPAPKRPKPDEAAALFDAAAKARGRRIIVSLEQRWLWLVEGVDTLLAAPVAVGKGESFRYRDRTYTFETPRGRRRVVGKETDPLWVPPDWHYYELAVDRGLEAVHLRRGQRVPLEDGTAIVVRGDQVGRVNRLGNFWPFTPGSEIIFDGKVFIPPIGTAQRRVPHALGTHKLDLGNGYLIHGTYEDDSVGRPVSHGCVRMYNEDILRLFRLVDEGTPVFIF